ncbi:MAG: hypothetical protein Q9213_003161 [Squamulea squamosa]
MAGREAETLHRELQYIGQNWRWGFGITDTAKRLKWFKLALDPDKTKLYSQLAHVDPDERAASPNRRQTPETLTTDYLTSLRIHFEAVLAKVLGSEAASTTPIEYILTVPAIWSDSAIAKTKACAEAAGMGLSAEIQIISEPEAAAVSVFHEQAAYGMDKDDTFVICDAGGGTVDLITYKIRALKPSLRIVEVAKGEGGMCGSTFLDRRFEAFLRNKFRSHYMWKEGMLEQAIKTFAREIKVNFTGCKTDSYEVPVPLPNSSEDDPICIRGSRYRFNGSDVFDIFEPVIQEVINLVKRQIQASSAVGADVKAVILVGGFGESQYLYKRLQEALGHQSVEVRMSHQAMTAVVRGALIRGLEEAKSKTALGTVTGRIARNHYGTECARKYEKNLHLKSQRFWSKVSNRYKVNTYEWFIQKCQKVNAKQKIHRSFHVERPVSTKKLEPVKITIVKCEEDEAPTFIDDNRVRDVTNLQVPLAKIKLNNIPTRKDEDGNSWYIIDFSLRATCYSAETHYDLMHNKKNYGRVTAEYV